MLSNESVGKFFVITLIPIISILTIDYYFLVLPFRGICLVLYILFLIVTTVWLTWIGIQTILKQNKPFTYDFENPYLKFIRTVYLFLSNTFVTDDTCQGYEVKYVDIDDLVKEQRNIDDRIADFTKDVEKYFIMKWYPKISTDQTFLKETKNLLDDVMRRFLQIIVQVDNKKLVHGSLIVFLKHTREFRKTVKRQQNSSKSIEDMYRYFHIASKNDKAFEHFMCQITTKVFRQFLSWELYNSVPCKCLVSILARKLVTYSLIYVANPSTINYRIAQLCFSKETKEKLQFDKYDSIRLDDVDLLTRNDKADDATLDVNSPLKEALFQEGNTPNVTPKKSEMVKGGVEVKKDVEEKNDKVIVMDIGDKVMENYGRDEVDMVTEKDASQVNTNHAISAPVKIHRSQSDRTWRNSSDLECISLGQDLLLLSELSDPDLQIQDLIDKKPWKDNSDSLEVDEKHHPIWNITENIEEVLESSKELNIPSPNIPSFISNTMKPIGNVTANTLHNMKELQQSTVNNVVKPVSQATSSAMHKIGDLQDEAAGVMEGIIDFGMAGIRKGLRLTGLQDNISDKTKLEGARVSKPIQAPHKPGRLAKIAHVVSEEAKNVPQEEMVWTNPLTKESPNFDGEILLEKSPVAIPIIPIISTEDTTSPDPEYEDVTDLATTTAKLRSLLQQKTSESNFNTPAVSPMPIDDANKIFSTPVEYPGRFITNSNSDEDGVDGTLPSLYKFCARTATGVFQNTLNTIKTALPGNISDQDHRQETMLDKNWDSENWMYVASDAGADDFSSRAQRLLNERRAFCTVDNAYEAVESLEVLSQVDRGWNTPTTVYEDELEDLEMHIPFTKTLTDIFSELASDTDTFLMQESVIKILLILFGNLSEGYISDKSNKIIKSINKFIGEFPTEPKKDNLTLTLDEFARLCCDIFPKYMKTIIGEDVFLSATKIFLTSLQSPKINQDIAVQLLELFASLIIEASNKMTPAYSA